MLNRIQNALSYLIYFFSADSEHGVHSPFVFNFVTGVIKARRNKPYYHAFEFLRTRMLKSNAEVEILPIGAGKTAGKMKLKNLVKRSAKSAKYAELLERIVEYFNPEYALEIGTSVGMSAMYQAAGMPNGVLYTLEGNPGSAKVAAHNFQEAGMANIRLVEGLFDNTLPVVLNEVPRLDYVFFDGNHRMEATLNYFETCLKKAHTGSVFVFDDIRWSEEMLMCWNKIKNHPLVKVTVDLHVMGIVFFRTEQEKEDFVIRF